MSSVPPSEADDPGPTLTRDSVAHLAHLARLDLTDAELDLYVDQLSVILHSVAAVSGVVGTRDIEPTSHAVPLTNVFREDVVRPGTDQGRGAGRRAVGGERPVPGSADPG